MATATKPRRYAPSQDALAIVLGKSPRMIAYYLAKGMPPATAKGYDVPRCREWITENVVDARNGKPSDLREAKLKAEIRKLREECRAKRAKNELNEGLVIDVSIARQWIGERFLRIKQCLELLPLELQLVVPGSVRDVVRSEAADYIHNLLCEMAGWKFSPEED